MDEKKYQVFVSSTYEDLFLARKKIIETVLSLYHFPVGMEMFSADDSDQWDIIKGMIDGTDYYVVIIGHKYGSIAPSGVSYTEMEYDYAKSLGVPVLAFIRNRNVGTTPGERETDFSKNERLERFIEKAKSNKMCDFWDSIDDLATKVAIALPKIMMRKPQTGWVRGNNSISKEISEELAELSLENRNLRERVREFESQTQGDKPILNVSVIESNIQMQFTPFECQQEYLGKITLEDVPSDLIIYVTQEMIDSYNKNIPSDNEVDKYNHKLFRYSNYTHNSLKLNPVMVNSGRRLATDIYVEIEFPEFITVLDSSNESAYIIEPKLKIPVSPIVKAREKKNLPAFFAPLGGIMEGLRDYQHVLNDDLLLGRLNGISSVSPRYSSARNSWVNCEEHSITLRAKKLLQSLTIEFDSIVIVPTGTGSGLIKFKIICEEFVEPIYFTREITVS
jgi:Domain of unknown function (DUF4062)